MILDSMGSISTSSGASDSGGVDDGSSSIVGGSIGGLSLTGTVTFQDNVAGRSGGGVYLENAGLVVLPDNVTAEGQGDGVVMWEGNTAGYDGAVVAVDGGTVHLEGGMYRKNLASQRGGVIFATGESLVEWNAGSSEDNTAPAGGALYISNSLANLTDIVLNGDNTPSGGVIFLAGADVRAVNVTVIAPTDGIGGGGGPGAFAIHVDANSVFRGFACSFELWSGGAPCVFSEGEAVLDSCDFTGSATDMLVSASPVATVRNAIVGDMNYVAAGYNSSVMFGVLTHTCDTLPQYHACLAPVSSGSSNPGSSATAGGAAGDGVTTVGEEAENGCFDTENGMGVFCPTFTVNATVKEVSLMPHAGTGTSAGTAGSTSSGNISSSGGGDGDGGGRSSALLSLELIMPSGSSVSDDADGDSEVVFIYPDLVTYFLVLRHPSSSSLTSSSYGSSSSSGPEQQNQTSAATSTSTSTSPSAAGSTEGMAMGGVIWELRFADGTVTGAGPNTAGVFINNTVTITSSSGTITTTEGSYYGDGFSWSAVPSSGLIAEGQELIIKVVGTPPAAVDPEEPSSVYNGAVSSAFFVAPRRAAVGVGATSTASSGSGSRSAEGEGEGYSNVATFDGKFYYCREEHYWDGQACVSCAEQMDSLVDGADALDCSAPGATLTALPLKEGNERAESNRIESIYFFITIAVFL